MGSDATISMFDQDQWNSRLVPTAIDVISGKTPPIWVQNALADNEWDLDFKFPKVPGFEDNCTAMIDLAAIDAGLYSCKRNDIKPRKFWGVKSDRRSCGDKDCLSKESCFFFGKNNRGAWDDFSVILSVMVKSVTYPELNDVFLGRTYTTSEYRDLLDEMHVPKQAEARRLLDDLGGRGFYVGYAFMTTAEGVNGWLMADECLALARELRQLDIPQFGSTADDLKNMDPLGTECKKMLREVIGYEARNKRWREITLAYLCAYAEHAGQAGKGIVWRNY